MIGMRVRHTTTYRYAEPVRLGPHRLILRPRESRELRLLTHCLTVTPRAQLTWGSDVSGNAVATALFDPAFKSMADQLTIASVADLELHATPWPVFDIAASAISYPFVYSPADWIDLGPLAVPQHADPGDRLRGWARAFIHGYPTDTLSLLKDLSAGVGQAIRYQVREDEGTQSPLETLELGQGSCRDLAVLFIEAARMLGFGARIASGYSYEPRHEAHSPPAEGTTHAWAEVFVPGAGWISFDPTNRRVGGFNLIPVAVAREIHQVMPVSGTFEGPASTFLSLSVAVTVEQLDRGELDTDQPGGVET